VQRLFARPALWWLGEVSYGIFCVHLLVLAGVVDLLEVDVFGGRFGSVLALTWTGSVAVAGALYVMVERPLMRLKGWVGSARTARPPNATASKTES
jgi:peptidoglycan/LPS O-acetylase OafA/YrhL